MVGGVEILFKALRDLGSQFSSSHDDMMRFLSKINRDVLQFVEMRIGSGTISEFLYPHSVSLVYRNVRPKL